MKIKGCLLARTEEAVLISVACCVVLLMTGCGSLDKGPGGLEGEAIGEGVLAAGQDVLAPNGCTSGHKGFFPLDIGNRWTYVGEFTLATDVGPPYVAQTWEERSIIGAEERFGREYVLEERFNIAEDGDTLSPFWFRYRQDRAGLYLADIAANEPPLDRCGDAPYVCPAADSRSEQLAGVLQRISRTIQPGYRDAYNRGWEELCLKLRVIESATGIPARFATVLQGPPGGVKPEEITLLRYPLHPFQEWIIRDDPFHVFGAVVGHEVLDLPPGRMNGYKTSIDNDLFGPDDWAYVWYGRDGYLGILAHLEVEILDPYGNPMGHMVWDEHSFLESLDLVRKGRCESSARTTKGRVGG